MDKSKVDFIADLLSEKRLNAGDKEKLFHLASKELISYTSLENRVAKLEENIFNYEVKKERNQNQQEEKASRNKIDYIHPYHLYQFLFEYNQNEILRSTCHDLAGEDIDNINAYCRTESYSFESHLQKIKEAYETHEKSYIAPYQVKALIRGYLTGKDYYGKKLEARWSTDRIPINWSSPSLIAWTKNNPGIPPNLNEDLMDDREVKGFEFNRINSSVLGDSFQTFTQLVLHFKHLFHIRHDNSLREIFENINKKKQREHSIEFYVNGSDFPKDIELFTDVDKLTQAYDRIIDLIIENHDISHTPQVRLALLENTYFVNISIHHINNTYNKTLQNTLERRGDRYDKLIKKQINGLCNLYLNAKFGDGNCATVNLWDEKKRGSEKIDQFQGVEHVLEFRKKPSK